MKPREGDLIETHEKTLFDVKGFVHPPDRVIAFVRCFPEEGGSRIKNGTDYAKIYSLTDRFEWVRTHLPTYMIYDPVFDETLCEVPVRDIVKHYDPKIRLKELHGTSALDELERSTVRMLEYLQREACVPWESLGVTGSILSGLYTQQSDIDLIVYGSASCRRIQSALKRLVDTESSQFSRYSPDDLLSLFEFRSKDNAGSFEDFVRTEVRKTCQGKFHGIDYFIRFVKGWKELHETYGEVQYRNIEYGAYEGTVVDDSEALFTPCTYSIRDVKSLGNASSKVSEIVSFRGRFCEQAKAGETVAAQGKIEKIIRQDGRSHLRLLLGNRPSDYMVVKQ